MKKILLCTALLATLGATAQTYEWQWAKRGGGTYESYQESGDTYDFDSEQIKDIVVDANNNYYYLAVMTYGNTTYENSPVTVYNNPGGCDVVLVATDCEGTLRWTQTIGGGGQDYAYKIALDNNGGLYLTASVLNISGQEPNTNIPPHFSPTVSLPLLEDNTGNQEGQKTGALLKYNTADGSLAWSKMLQGDVNVFTKNMNVSQLQIDSNGTIHMLVGFLKGTHLDGLAVVPDTYTDTYKFYIAKFNSAGTVLSALEVPMEGSFLEYHSDFRYDENLQRYYMAGFRFTGNNTILNSLSYNAVPFQYQAYVLAISSTGAEVWRKEINSTPNIGWNEIHDIQIDSDSNVYITGKSFISSDTQVKIGTYPFPDAVTGNVIYIMKMAPSGDILWLKTPSGYTNPSGDTANEYSFSLAVNGDEVALACQGMYTIWDTVSMVRPENFLSDPVLVRFNKATGAPIAMHDIMGPAGYTDALTAVTKDNDGNYVVGGYFRNSLFTNADAVPTIEKVQNAASYTDFFMAKLASGPCGTLGISPHTDSSSFKLYPNPSTGQVQFESEETLVSYEVLNLLGQSLLNGNLKSGQKSISIESLSPGTYLLNFKTVSGKAVGDKIIKK